MHGKSGSNFESEFEESEFENESVEELSAAKSEKTKSSAEDVSSHQKGFFRNLLKKNNGRQSAQNICQAGEKEEQTLKDQAQDSQGSAEAVSAAVSENALFGDSVGSEEPQKAQAKETPAEKPQFDLQKEGESENQENSLPEKILFSDCSSDLTEQKAGGEQGAAVPKTKTEKNQKKSKNILAFIRENKKAKCGMAAAAALLLAAGVYGSVNGIDYLLHGKKAYAITVDNKEVATVSSYLTANSVIKDYLAGGYNSTEIKGAHFTDDVKITKVYEPQSEILDYDSAQSKLAENAATVAECVTVKADGREIVSLSNEADAEKALELLKKAYAPTDENLKVTDVKFKENVEICDGNADVSKIYSPEEAVSVMKKLTETESYVYTVGEGETLETVCESQGVSVDSMTKLDDSTDFEALRAGDRLQIDKEKNLINVLTTVEETKQEIISYNISYQENDEMPAGTQNVVQEGFDGAEIVDLKIVRINDSELYRERLSAETTIQPTTKVVDCGTKVFRDNGETGKANITSANQMIWPTTATAISSPYGIRSRGFHTGLDINGETGDSVWAALSGTVTTAGWAGNYGNCVVIKHSDGLSTRYAHLSAISVGLGEKVTQGQVIGLEGSTGNSTGSHLHFEVIISGTAVDPLIYISR